MKKPVAVTIGVIAHTLFAAWMLFGVVLYWHESTWRGNAFLVILFLCQVVGIVGLTQRYSWARLYSLVIFGYYALMHFGNLSKAAKAVNLLSLLWSFIVIIAMVWLMRGLTFSDAKEYFATKGKILINKKSAAEQVAAPDTSSGSC